jgi:indole-3-glycerol phosphate synthase
MGRADPDVGLTSVEMTQKTETILDQIIADKRDEVEAAKLAVPLPELKRESEDAPQARSFSDALKRPGIGLIAELKKASPSRGLLRADFDPVGLAAAYRDAGAAAISVLTDEKHFQGSLSHLRAVSEALPAGPSLLRKDFLFDEYQVYEARYYGADAILLITAVLEDDDLRTLIALAKSLAMDALVEVHDDRELDRAIASGAKIIGINNRDLRTFEVDLATTERLAPLVPPDKTIVAESGIFMRDDVRRLKACGVDAVLIGEALVTAEDPGAKIRELFV